MQKLLHINSIQWLKPFWRKKKWRVCIPDRLHAVRSVERKQGLLSLIPISNYGGPNVQNFPPYLSHPERGNGHTRHFRRAREQHGIGIPWSQTCRSGQNGARASDRKQKALPPKLVNAKGREAHAGDWAVVGETNEIVSQTVQCWIWKRNMFFLSWKSTIFCDPVGLQTTPFFYSIVRLIIIQKEPPFFFNGGNDFQWMSG